MGVEGDFRRPMETVPRQQDTFPRMQGIDKGVSMSLIWRGIFNVDGSI